MSVASSSIRYVIARRAWLAAVVALASGGGAYSAGLSPQWSLTIGLVAPLVLAVAPAFVRGVITGLVTPRVQERVPTEVAAMSGEQFEDYVALAARSCGLPVIMTPVTGDYGVDLVVGQRPDRLAVQCKRQARPVGSSAVQEVVAGAVMHDCTRTMVVTNQTFTPAARRLADEHDCVLVGGAQLSLLRSMIRQAAAPTPLS